MGRCALRAASHKLGSRGCVRRAGRNGWAARGITGRRISPPRLPPRRPAPSPLRTVAPLPGRPRGGTTAVRRSWCLWRCLPRPPTWPQPPPSSASSTAPASLSRPTCTPQWWPRRRCAPSRQARADEDAGERGPVYTLRPNRYPPPSFHVSPLHVQSAPPRFRSCRAGGGRTRSASTATSGSRSNSPARRGASSAPGEHVGVRQAARRAVTHNHTRTQRHTGLNRHGAEVAIPSWHWGLHALLAFPPASMPPLTTPTRFTIAIY